MNVDEFLKQNDARLQANSQYERQFVDQVLRAVRGIDFKDVTHEREVTVENNRHYRIDFTVEEGEAVQIAIEIDGYEKYDGGTRAAYSNEHAKALERTRLLTLAGFQVFHYANRDVIHRPQSIALQIELILKQAREGRLDERERVEYDRLESDRLRGIEEAQEALQKGLDELRSEQDDMRSKREKDRRATKQLKKRVDEIAVPPTSGSSRHLGPSSAKYLAIAIVLLGVTLAGAWFVVGRSPSANACPAAAVSWDAVGNMESGDRTTIIGPVAGSRYQKSGLQIDIGQPSPDPSRFNVFVPNAAVKAMSQDWVEAVTTAGQTLAVSGELSEYKGLRQIVVTGADQVSACS